MFCATLFAMSKNPIRSKSTPSSSCPNIFIRFGRCQTAIMISAYAGGKSNRLFPDKLQKKNKFQKAAFVNTSEEYGNGDFGNMQSGMMTILDGMSITFISIPSNTVMCRKWPIGRIRRFIGMFVWVFCRRIGRGLMRNSELIWNKFSSRE
jgi:hypothetical protein